MATGTITSLGVGSGLDLQDILDQLKEVDANQITKKETTKTGLQQKIDAFNSVNAKLLSLKSTTLSLSLESNFLKNNAAVSDEDIFTATVNDGIAESTSTVEVVRKARQNSWQTAGVASKTSLIYAEPSTGITSTDATVTTATETMTIKYGADGEQKDIDVGLTSGMSLTQIAEKINESSNNKDDGGTQLVTATVEKAEKENETDPDSYYIRIRSTSEEASAETQVSVSGFDYVKADSTIGISLAGSSTPGFVRIPPGTTYQEAEGLINNSDSNPGVTARLIDDGTGTTPFRLTIVSNDTGENNRITIQNLTMEEVSGNGESLNAELSVNGITYERQFNDSITDIIPGVTLNLKKTGESSISVNNSLDTVKEDIVSFVTGINELISQIKGTGSTTENDTETDTSETTSPLSDSYSAKTIIYTLQSLIGSSINTNSPYKSLYDLGMEINRDGTISIDEEALDEAVASNPDAVRSLFIGDSDSGVKGLGDLLNNGLSAMVNSTGTVTTEIDAMEANMERIDDDIETATERLNKRYETMAAEFSRLDVAISQLNSQSDYLTSIIDSFNNANSD